LEDLGVDGKTILKWISFKEVGLEDVDWVHLPQDREQWKVLVNTFHKRQEIS
jgi:hypothetical protein